MSKKNYKYMIMVRVRAMDDQETTLDSFYEIDLPDVSTEDLKNMHKLNNDFGKEANAALFGMKLRKTFNNDIFGPILIKTGFKMERDDMEMYVQTLTKAKLKELIKDGAI